jgi:hypothetical protein
MSMMPICEFDGYFATSDGQIIGRHGRPLAFYLDKDGYRRVTLAAGKGAGAQRLHRGIHQLVCAAFNGPCPEGLLARHLDGSRDNNIPDNLKWGTLVENSADRIAHGTVPRGEKHHLAKLTDRNVLNIRRLIAQGFPERKVAKVFGVSQGTIHMIKVGRTWTHVENAHAH